MPAARVFARDVGDPDRRRFLVNTCGAAAVLAVLLVAVAAAALGASWGIWVGFAAGAAALIGAAANMKYALSGTAPPPAKTPTAERTRVTRLLRRGRPIPAKDAELADTMARANLRSIGLSMWTGPLIAGGQIDALPIRSGDSIFQLVLLVIALALSLGTLVLSVRLRRGLANPSPRASPE